MEKKNRNRLAGWKDHVTSTISVTLVLFVLGLVGVVNIAFSGASRQVKENIGFTVVLTDSVPATVVANYQNDCKQANYISTFTYMSAEDVLNEETCGEGNDLIDLLGVNPYTAMFELKMKAEYAGPDSITKLAQLWSARDYVDEVMVNTEMIRNLDRNARLINMILIVVAAALLLISFVLINNTVRLTVYARRFLIHTMKLVGATGSFIRRPFIIINGIQGVIAGVFASALMCGLTVWAYSWPAVESLLPWSSIILVCIGMVVLGVVICMLGAAIATNKYLRKDYDSMFEE